MATYSVPPLRELSDPAREMWESALSGVLREHPAGVWMHGMFRRLSEAAPRAYPASTADFIAGVAAPLYRFSPSLLRNGPSVYTGTGLIASSIYPYWISQSTPTGGVRLRPIGRPMVQVNPGVLALGDPNEIASELYPLFADRNYGLPATPFSIGAHEGTHLSFNRMLERLYGRPFARRGVNLRWRPVRNPAADQIARGLTRLTTRLLPKDLPRQLALEEFGAYPIGALDMQLVPAAHRLRELVADTGSAVLRGVPLRPVSEGGIGPIIAKILQNQPRAGLGFITPGLAAAGAVGLPVAALGVQWLIDQLTGDES